jgi:hypothetical protein
MLPALELQSSGRINGSFHVKYLPYKADANQIPKAVARISQKLYTMTAPWSSARANAAAGQQGELHLALCPRS